jgi:hypothetical protein
MTVVDAQNHTGLATADHLLHGKLGYFSFEDTFLNQPHRWVKAMNPNFADGFRWSPHLSRANGLAITM